MQLSNVATADASAGSPPEKVFPPHLALFTSFVLAIMFPTISALGLKGLGRDTKIACSFLVMASIGGAIFPLTLGWIAKTTGSLASVYIVPAVGFVGVALYGFLSSRGSAGSG